MRSLHPRFNKRGGQQIEAPHLPRLSWLLDVSDARWILTHGTDVEVEKDWFFEGAWAGPYNLKGLGRARYRFGSGAILRGDHLRLLPPSHSLEAIYCLVLDGRLLASNSFGFLAGVCPELMATLDFPAVVSRVRTARSGITNYERVLASGSGWSLNRYMYQPVDVDLIRPVPIETNEDAGFAPFDSYQSYVNHLTSTVEAVVANSRSHNRRRPYTRVAASCSSGYDSPAVAVIARGVGCDRVVTLRTGRGGTDDSGSSVARALGMECLEFDRFATAKEVEQDREFLLDLGEIAVDVDQHGLFLASISTLEDAVFAPFRSEIEGSIFLSGFQGGTAWKRKGDESTDIVRGDNSGSGIGEFRLHTGFVHMPVPFVGARHVAVLRAIANSAELAPFAIGGSYDRPVPRRILEEAGVPRALFGRTKKRGAVLFTNSHAARVASLAAVAERYTQGYPGARASL